MKRLIGMIVAIIGVASLVMGIIFIVQSNSAKKQIADSITPVKMSELNATYDTITAKHDAVMTSEEPQIQAGKAAPSATYNYLSAQRALLGLAKSNVGVAGFLQTSGVLDIVLGVGLLLVGFAFTAKEKA
jgi:hypothetical protein